MSFDSGLALVSRDGLLEEKLGNLYSSNSMSIKINIPSDVPITSYQNQLNEDMLNQKFEPFIIRACKTGIKASEAILFLTENFGWIKWSAVLAGVVVVGIKELAKIIKKLAEYKITIEISKKEEQQIQPAQPDPTPENPNPQVENAESLPFDPEDNELINPEAEPPENEFPDPAQEEPQQMVVLIDDDGYLVRADGKRFVKDILMGVESYYRYEDLTEEQKQEFAFQATGESDLVFNPAPEVLDIEQEVNEDIPPEEEENFPTVEPLPLTAPPTPPPTPPPEPDTQADPQADPQRQIKPDLIEVYKKMLKSMLKSMSKSNIQF